jgi:hypothetical protein
MASSSSSSYRSWADRIVVAPIDTKETDVESVSTSAAPSPPSLVGEGTGSTSFAVEGEHGSGEDGRRRDSDHVHVVPELSHSGSCSEGPRVFLAPVDAHSSDELFAIPAATELSSSFYEQGPEIIDLTTISDVASADPANDEEYYEGRASRAPAPVECAVRDVPFVSSEVDSLDSSPQNPIVVVEEEEEEEDYEEDAGNISARQGAGNVAIAVVDSTHPNEAASEPLSDSPAVSNDDHAANPSTSVAADFNEEDDSPQEDNSMMKENRNDITATTSMDVTGMTVNDDDDEDDDDDELKYSDSLRTDEHEIAFGAGHMSDHYGDNHEALDAADDDDDELNLDALLARTADDDDDENNDHVEEDHGDVDSAAAEDEDGGHATQADGVASPDDEMDDLLNELLDETQNAAEELDDLLNEQQEATATAPTVPPTAEDAVPHVGDVDEAKAVSQPVSAPIDAETVSAAPTSRAATPVSVTSSKPSAMRHVQPLANLGKDEGATAAHKDTMPDAKVTRPNLSARIPGTRRYVAPSSKAKKSKPSLTIEISESEDNDKTPTKVTSPSRRRWSPKSDVASTQPRNASGAATVASAASAASSSSPAKKKSSMIKTFTRALSSGPPKPKKSPPGELSPRARGVLPTLKPIDPHSRLLKETSASVAQKRNRFIPPPLSFPSIGEVMRAIHSGAFDRKSAAASSSSSASSRSPRWGGGAASKSGTDCGASTASSRSRPRKKSAL